MPPCCVLQRATRDRSPVESRTVARPEIALDEVVVSSGRMLHGPDVAGAFNPSALSVGEDGLSSKRPAAPRTAIRRMPAPRRAGVSRRFRKDVVGPSSRTRTPIAAPAPAPIPTYSRQSGAIGRSGTRAGSRSLNCSPIWRRSRLAATRDSSIFASRSLNVVCSTSCSIANVSASGCLLLPALRAQLLVLFHESAASVFELSKQKLIGAFGQHFPVPQILFDEQRRQAFGHPHAPCADRSPMNPTRNVVTCSIASTFISMFFRILSTISSHDARAAFLLVQVELLDDALEPRSAQNLLRDASAGDRSMLGGDCRPHVPIRERAEAQRGSAFPTCTPASPARPGQRQSPHQGPPAPVSTAANGVGELARTADLIVRRSWS